MSTIKEITTEDEFRTHVASLHKQTLLIISFYANWAAPCKPMKTVLEMLAAEYPVTEPAQTNWVRLHAEEEALSNIMMDDAYNVTAVPYLVLQRDDKVLEKVTGSSAIEVREAIERHAKPYPATTNGTTIAEKKQDMVAAADVVETSVDPEKAKKELYNKLGELVKAASVMLFMKGTPSSPQCGFSRQMVAILRERSVKYGFFNILADDEVRQGLKEYADWPTYPQLWVDGELVGGLDIVKEELEANPDFFKAYSVPKEDGSTAAA